MSIIDIKKTDNVKSTEEPKMSHGWHPKMGDYNKPNSEEDIKVIKNKILKTNLFVGGLIVLLLGVLVSAILFFLNQ